MTQINTLGNLDCIPDYEEEFLLSEAIEDFYAQRWYAHTDSAGTTVLAGHVATAQAQRDADQAAGGFVALVCTPDWRLSREA